MPLYIKREAVPSHVGYLVLMLLRDESFYFRVEDAQAVGIALFRMTAHQLLSDANAQDGLREGTNHLVQSVLAKVAHRVARLALTRENHTVGASQLYGGIRQQGFYAHTLQSMDDGKDVSGIVFDYCDLHNAYPRIRFGRQRYIFYI